MTDSNKTKADFLGMPYGTACGRLRKALLFTMASELGKTDCFRCGKPIKSAAELSIDHKVEWLYNSTELFWDLGNIAFSHLSCNTAHQRRPHQKVGPPETSWCANCKTFLPTSSFTKQNPCSRRTHPSKNGLRRWCRKCEHRRRRDQRRRAKLRSGV